MFLMKRPFRRYLKFWTCNLDCDLWPTFKKTLSLGITCLCLEVGLSYLAYAFLMTRPFRAYHKFWCVTLTVTFDLVLKKFNIGHNSFVLRGRVFIFGMCVPYDKAFPMVQNVPYILNLWSWPWPLTYFWKTLTLAITYPKIYGIHIWHVCSLWQGLSDSSILFQHVTLTVTYNLLLKNFNIGGHSSLVVRGRAFICGIHAAYDKTSLIVP